MSGITSMETKSPGYMDVHHIDSHSIDSGEHEKIINLKSYNERDEDYDSDNEKKVRTKKVTNHDDSILSK